MGSVIVVESVGVIGTGTAADNEDSTSSVARIPLLSLLVSTLLLSFMIIGVHAQNWQDVAGRSNIQPEIKVQKFRTLTFSPQSLQARMSESREVKAFELPLPYGGTEQFMIRPSDVLPIELGNKYGIKAFTGYAVHNPNKKIR